MNKMIFKAGRLFAVAALAALTLTACEKDDDSNPTLHKNTTGFTVNTPANAQNNTYDLLSASRAGGSLTITCSQPDYQGVPYVVNYFTQVAIDPSFADYYELESPSNKASIKLDAGELNDAVISLFLNAHPDDVFPNTPMPLYVRVKAQLVNVANTVLDEVMSSNYITLPSVLATEAPKTIELPTKLFIVGNTVGNGDSRGYWSYWKPMAGIYGTPGEFFTMVYAPADGGQFKWGEAEGDWRGYDAVTTFNDQANANLSAADDGNIVVGNPGWYVIHVVAEVGANAVKYTFNIHPAAAYVIGAGAGGDWTDSNADWKMEPDANGIWTSPAFTAGGEMRAYIKVPGYDWWKTEFTLYKGSELYFRDFDIPNNWAENAADKGNKADPENYSVTVSAGNKLYVNFNDNTGEVK